MKVSVDSAVEVCQELLTACGVEKEDVTLIMDTMLYADRRGITTHGMARMPLYVKKMEKKMLNPLHQVEVVVDFEAISVLDAHNGFGQVAAMHALGEAEKKAKQYGIAAVGVRNSNNFGAAGYFGNLAASHGYASVIYANAAPAIAPTGGNKAILGTNPIAMSFPGFDGQRNIVLDMATTVAARGKIRAAAKSGTSIPMDWATDKDGNKTDDPSKALEGLLLPIGGYKGYGLSLFVDLLAGMLTGSAYAGSVNPLSDMERPSGNGHFFILIDVLKFCEKEEYEQRLDVLVREIKKCGDEECVLLPGERGYLTSCKNKDSIEVGKVPYAELNALTKKYKIEKKLEILDEES